MRKSTIKLEKDGILCTGGIWEDGVWVLFSDYDVCESVLK